MQEYFWMAASFAVGILATLTLSNKRRSIVLYFLLLAVLLLLFGVAGAAGGIVALAYRYAGK